MAGHVVMMTAAPPPPQPRRGRRRLEEKLGAMHTLLFLNTACTLVQMFLVLGRPPAAGL